MASCQCVCVCVCVCAAPPMVPPAPWQLKPEHLQRVAPRGVLFCIIIKDAYGARETAELHVCHAGSEKKKEKLGLTLCAEIAATRGVSARAFFIFFLLEFRVFSQCHFLLRRAISQGSARKIREERRCRKEKRASQPSAALHIFLGSSL